MKRSAFLATAAAAALPLPVLAQSAKPVFLRLTGTGADDVVSVLYAQQSGMFRAVGLDTDYERSNSGAAGLAAVVSGAKDIGKSSMGSLIAARARNIDIKVVAGGALFVSADPRGSVELIVAADAPYKTGRDLNGKTFSVPALGDQNVMAAKAWVDQNGGDSSTLQFIEVPSSAAAAAVVQGRIAAAVMVPPFAARALADGKVRSLAKPFVAIAPRFLETAWYVSASYAQAHRDPLARFAKVVSDASAYVNAHDALVADMMAKFSGQTAAAVLKNGISDLSTSVDVKDIQPLIDAEAKYGLIKRPFDAAEFLLK